LRLVIISGRSGSGKSLALHALEDLGFYCIDNLPLSLLSGLESHIGGSQPLVAVSIDARNIATQIPHFKEIVSELNNSRFKREIIYLDASDSILLRRFSETRRKHPLSNENTSLKEAIRKEKELLTPIATMADLTIDTGPLNRQALYELIKGRVAAHQGNRLQVLLQSFGYNQGLPPDADFVFDLRCLPNPYWEPSLRELTGKDKAVIEYLSSKPEVKRLEDEIYQFLLNWIPMFEADHRSYVTVALGCTGGQHRSVFLTENLAERLRKKMPNIQLRHRELES
jgi:UPF0042 nucleotide-binding protein